MKMLGYGLHRDEYLSKTAAADMGRILAEAFHNAQPAMQYLSPKARREMATVVRRAGADKNAVKLTPKPRGKKPQAPAPNPQPQPQAQPHSRGQTVRVRGRRYRQPVQPMPPQAEPSAGIGGKVKSFFGGLFKREPKSPTAPVQTRYVVIPQKAPAKAPVVKQPAPAKAPASASAPAEASAQAGAQTKQQAQQRAGFDWNDHFARNKTRYQMGGAALAGSALTGLYMSNRNPQPYLYPQYGYPPRFY